MGCYSSRSTVEDSIKDFWNQNPIMDLNIKQYIDMFEKLTAYKKDIRTSNGFLENVLNKLFHKENINQTNEYMKKNYLDITSHNDICIPIALMFLTESKDHIELEENYSKLLHIVRGRIDNPRKLKNDINCLKEILKFYVTLITLYSFNTIFQKFENKEDENIKVFYDIYSSDSIERNFSILFNFESNIQENENAENIENDGNNLEMDNKSPEAICYFFKVNFKNLKADSIREKLFISHEIKIRDEKNGIFIDKAENENETPKRTTVAKRKTKNLNKQSE